MAAEATDEQCHRGCIWWLAPHDGSSIWELEWSQLNTEHPWTSFRPVCLCPQSFYRNHDPAFLTKFCLPWLHCCTASGSLWAVFCSRNLQLGYPGWSEKLSGRIFNPSTSSRALQSAFSSNVILSFLRSLTVGKSSSGAS